jgi:primosomal protein N' (replication factor Y) (superfamily II helicase)
MLYFFKVTPLINLPSTANQEFTYSSTQKTNKGDLVLTNFRNRKKLGIITEIIKRPQRENYAIKKILKIIEKRYFNEKQLALLQDLAKYYQTSFSLFLKIAVPQKVISRKKYLSNRAVKGSFKITQAEINQAKKLINFSQENKKIFLFAKDRLNIYFYLIARIINGNGQVLFLVPDILLLKAFYLKLVEIFGAGKIAVLNKEKAKGDYYSNWESIKNGTGLIILGTRSTIFANFKNLKLVIIEEAQDSSYKQWDQKPYYDARFVVDKLPDYFDCSVIFGSYCPNIDFYWKFKRREAIFKIPDENKKMSRIKTRRKIIDARIPNNFDQSSFITEQVIQKIKENLNKGKTVFLGTSQGGSSNCYFCNTCGYIPKCPRCERNLYPTGRGELKCPVCGMKVKLASHCPKCGNRLVKMIGLGSRRIYQEVQKIFPQFQAVLIDKDERKISREKKENLAIFLKRGIAIGNLSFLRLAKFNNFTGAVISINADKSLFLPDFTGGEKKYQETTQLLSKKYNFFLQTKYPKKKTIIYSLTENFEKFYKREISLRKKEKLPPFSKLIKFTSREDSSQRARNNLEKLAALIKKDKQKICFFSEPYPGYPEKIRKKYIFHLTIGYPPNLKNKIIENLIKKDYCLKRKIAIDIDPLGLI